MITPYFKSQASAATPHPPWHRILRYRRHSGVVQGGMVVSTELPAVDLETGLIRSHLRFTKWEVSESYENVRNKIIMYNK